MKKIVLVCFLISMASISTAQSGYHLVNTLHIPSPGRWDYIAVSPIGDNLYVSHQTQVNIINKNTGDSTGVIANTTGVHGIAFATEFNEGYISNGKLNNLTVFNLKTNETIGNVVTGENPDAIMYDDFTKRIYVCNGKSKDLTIIDPKDNKVIKTVFLDGKPETAVSNNAGLIYINIEDKNEIVVVDAKTFAIRNRWKTGKGEEPSGLAIDTKTKRLFAGCSNKLLIVMDAATGKIIKELPIGDGCDGVAFDAELKLVFSSNGDGTLTVIREKSPKDIDVLENVQTKKGARTIAIDEHTHKIYLPTADFAPAKTKESRPEMIPGSFQVLVLEK